MDLESRQSIKKPLFVLLAVFFSLALASEFIYIIGICSSSGFTSNAGQGLAVLVGLSTMFAFILLSLKKQKRGMLVSVSLMLLFYYGFSNACSGFSGLASIADSFASSSLNGFSSLVAFLVGLSGLVSLVFFSLENVFKTKGKKLYVSFAFVSVCLCCLVALLDAIKMESPSSWPTLFYDLVPIFVYAGLFAIGLILMDGKAEADGSRKALSNESISQDKFSMALPTLFLLVLIAYMANVALGSVKWPEMGFWPSVFLFYVVALSGICLALGFGYYGYRKNSLLIFSFAFLADLAYAFVSFGMEGGKAIPKVFSSLLETDLLSWINSLSTLLLGVCSLVAFVSFLFAYFLNKKKAGTVYLISCLGAGLFALISMVIYVFFVSNGSGFKYPSKIAYFAYMALISASFAIWGRSLFISPHVLVD